MYRLVFIFVIILFSSFAYSNDDSSNSKKEFMGKIGTAYSSKPEKFGLDFSMSYFYKIDPYFYIGGELDYFWIKWDRSLGEEDIGLVSADKKATTNAYIIPLFFDFQVRLPNLLKKIYIIPAITGGIGWSGMILNNSISEHTVNNELIKASSSSDFYNGFAAQLFFSAYYQPENSKIMFLSDIGYRWVFPEKNGIEFDMSGFFIRLGVKVYL
jgi:hypothetical protein